MDQNKNHDDTSSSRDLVAQVNMVDEDEPDDAGDWIVPEPSVAALAAAPEDAPSPRVQILPAVALGLVALGIIGISMFVILRGVFEMIPD